VNSKLLPLHDASCAQFIIVIRRRLGFFVPGTATIPRRGIG